MTSLCFEKNKQNTLVCGLVGIKGRIRGDGFKSTFSRGGTMMAAQSSKVSRNVEICVNIM